MRKGCSGGNGTETVLQDPWTAGKAHSEHECKATIVASVFRAKSAMNASRLDKRSFLWEKASGAFRGNVSRPVTSNT